MKTIILLMACMLTSAFAPAQIDLTPVADTWVDSANPTKNYGTSTTLKFGRLYVSGSTNPLFRTYLLFNLNPYKNLKIQKATLSIYEYGGHAAGSLSKTLNTVKSAWRETSMTWNNKAAHGTVLKSFSAGGSYRGWINVDVTAQVQAWINGNGINNGFVYKHPTENQAGASRPAYCYSREYGSADRRPVLRLNLGLEIFGKGCGSPQAPVIGHTGMPLIGTNFTINLTSAPPSKPALLFLGSRNTSWGSFPLPLDLTPYGFKAPYWLPCSNPSRKSPIRLVRPASLWESPSQPFSRERQPIGSGSFLSFPAERGISTSPMP